MSQFFVNFTQPTGSSRSGAHIQTKQVSVSSGSSGQLIELDWDTPFSDSNYTVSIAIESEQFQGQTIPIASFYKTAASVFVTVNGIAFIPFTVHAVAFHV